MARARKTRGRKTRWTSARKTRHHFSKLYKVLFSKSTAMHTMHSCTTHARQLTHTIGLLRLFNLYGFYSCRPQIMHDHIVCTTLSFFETELHSFWRWNFRVSFSFREWRMLQSEVGLRKRYLTPAHPAGNGVFPVRNNDELTGRGADRDSSTPVQSV